MKYCIKCGTGMGDEASFCPNCGTPAAAPVQPEQSEPVQIVQQPEPAEPVVVQPAAEPQYMSRQQQPVAAQINNINVTAQTAPAPKRPTKNGFGVAGFILTLLGLCLTWIPIVGPYFGFGLAGLGLIFAVVGLIFGICQKRTIGLSIAALLIGAAAIIGGASLLESWWG